MNLKKLASQFHNKSLYFLAVLVIAFGCKQSPKEFSIVEVIDEVLVFAQQQNLRMAEKYAAQDSILPRSFVNGKMTTSDSRWWTSGFFPGVLWYLYQNSGVSVVLDYARQYTTRIEREKYTTDSHDVGIMLYCSFGSGLRLTGKTAYREVLLTGAKSLSTRYNPKVGLIRSWDFNKDKWNYPVIIDNMMNLELLLWASEASGNITFRDIALIHADKTMQNHYRSDYSCYHVVSYDTITGIPHKKQTHQGYSEESSWSCGKAWGLYGYTFIYHETDDARYLEQAKQIASFMINHPNMPEHYIPYWDSDALGIPNEYRDASAAALMASALIEFSTYVDKEMKDQYVKTAENQICTLASPR